MMDGVRREYDASCHCKSVIFRVRLKDDFNSVRRCSCSYCRMRGAIAATADVGDIDFIKGEQNLTVYQFNTREAKHYFCKTCGIYTHHQRRSNPTQFGVNVACIEGVSPFDFLEVPVMDGISHPSDTGSGPKTLGLLRFEPTTQKSAL